MTVSKRLRFEIFKRDNHTCRYCGGSAPDVKLTVDHVVPTALGGADEPTNLVTACSGCNAGKSSISPTDATVQDVKEDASRWAAAMETAARIQLSHLDKVDHAAEEFWKIWNSWHWEFAGEKSRYPVPANWRQSIDQFIAAGLDERMMLDKIEVAMAKDYCRDRWRFFCGCCWKEIEKRQAIAASVVALDEEPDGSN